MRAVVLVLGLMLAPLAGASPIAFTGVNVVPMDEERQLPDHTVVVDAGRIVAVGPVGEVEVPEGARVVDGRGHWLMPGLAEMHGHVPPVAQAAALDNVLDLFLANGVTTVRGVLGEPGHLALRDSLASGERQGPRLLTSGPSLNGNTVGSPEQAVELVEAQKAAGYDLAKLHPGLTLENFDAIMEAANRVGLPVVGHVPAAAGIEHALSMGMACIEHMDDYVRGLVPEDRPERTASPGFFGLDAAMAADRARIPVLVEATRSSGAAISPTETLMVSILGSTPAEEMLDWPEMKYVAPATKAQWQASRAGAQSAQGFSRERADRFLQLRRELLKALHDGGVPIVLGSDAPQVFNVPGFSAHREMALMVEAGLTPFQALRTGTVEVARHIGAEGHRGVVAPGMAADLVLLGADPLADIANAGRIEGVMVAGRWYDRADLDARLARVEQAVGE
ncbi:amidohydrolase family protein [Alkalisalibacterium limincola]|uniref:Amidohydrolase family protein n=1 Tax=Alkalisalibacterium limincola TaxID=2699169 RepID=A0A5C8KXM1_9GAMM|nr:amidohydrolase family protein [Alkalisalibacterium limincola]TXK64333.1 amidohydrolase family protein [Alkalisalibacterium limincola]